MEAPQAPAAPDPAKTAAAQSASNIASATNQQYLNMVDQKTPYGSLTYTQNGDWGNAAPAGSGTSGSDSPLLKSFGLNGAIGGTPATTATPKFTATTTLSPEEQKLFDLNTQTQGNLGQIGVDQSSKIGALLNTPFSVDAARGQKIQDLQNTFLNPQWDRGEAAKKNELFNAGVRPGSEAYDQAMREFSTNKQRAYDQSYLDSYNAGNQAALTDRNQPINEITALLSGAQVQNPSFTNTPNAGVAPTDVIGAQGQALAQQNIGYQGQLANTMGINSGLFGLGSAALGGWGRSGFSTKAFS